jgi:hypothetical protein
VAVDRTDPLASLDWLAGCWQTTGRGGPGDAVAEEVWQAPRGGLMLGLSRSLRPGRRPFHEHLRIEAGPDGIAYVASPAGQATTSFRLVRRGDRAAVFENPAHDDPQRIAYARVGDRLTAVVSDLAGSPGKTRRFAWRRVPCARAGLE